MVYCKTHLLISVLPLNAINGVLIDLIINVVFVACISVCSAVYASVLVTELHGRFTGRTIADRVERGGQSYIHDWPSRSSFLRICSPVITLN